MSDTKKKATLAERQTAIELKIHDLVQTDVDRMEKLRNAKYLAKIPLAHIGKIYDCDLMVYPIYVTVAYNRWRLVLPLDSAKLDQVHELLLKRHWKHQETTTDMSWAEIMNDGKHAIRWISYYHPRIDLPHGQQLLIMAQANDEGSKCEVVKLGTEMKEVTEWEINCQ